MKVKSLKTEILGLSIALFSTIITSCGGSGGGSSSSNSQSSPSQSSPQTQPSTGLSSNFANGMYIFQGTDYVNEPLVTVYVDGYPVNLLLDTGASGILVNASAINIPQTAFTKEPAFGAFGDGSTYYGIVASATVCLSPNNTNDCVIMPIVVDFEQTAFPTSGEAQGDFGIDCGQNPFASNAYCYLYYLYNQNQSFNSFSLAFNSMNNFYNSTTGQIGSISFGNFNANFISYSGGFPSTSAVFPSYTNMPSFTAGSVFFDTGSNFNYLTTDVFKTEIPNFSSSSYEGNCNTYNLLIGGVKISYELTNYNTSFTTQPPSNMCSVFNQPSVIQGITLDAGSYASVGYEDFGLSEMLRHGFIYKLGNNGFTSYISINP